jgi:hypothetical protein
MKILKKTHPAFQHTFVNYSYAKAVLFVVRLHHSIFFLENISWFIFSLLSRHLYIVAARTGRKKYDQNVTVRPEKKLAFSFITNNRHMTVLMPDVTSLQQENQNSQGRFLDNIKKFQPGFIFTASDHNGGRYRAEMQCLTSIALFNVQV